MNVVEMTINYTEINEIKMRYQELPKEGREAVIFLHFGGSSLGVWNGVQKYFEDNYHIIAPDLRCHGFSSHDVDSCHIDDMAKDISELMKRLNIEKAYVVGSSLGALTAISLAKNHPEQVLALVLDGGLYDTDGPDSKDQLIDEEEIKKAKDDFKKRVLSTEKKYYNSKEDFIATYRSQWEEYFPWSEIVEKAILDNIIESKDGKISGTQSAETTWKYIEPLYGVRLREYFKEIKCPVLWLPDEKEKDQEIVIRNLKKYAKNLPNHEIVTIEGSVHAYTCLLKPEEFASEVLNFIETIKGL
ncbi:MAG: alpha/beta fold hydrolase [Candidatus Heimdallarchaeota archaeon]|nr:alpha/beta fold hydrolase [Candidatus Heimdallarchaeota archaeon]